MSNNTDNSKQREVTPMSMEVDHVENDIESNSMKLTDVINDCLEMIFDHLNVRDLFCVALASTKFTEIAKLVFKRNYGESVMIGDNRITYRRLVDFNSPDYQFLQSLNELTFIRIFGDVIQELHVVARSSSALIRHIHEYIAQFFTGRKSAVFLVIMKIHNAESNRQPMLTHKTLVQHLQNELSGQESHFAVKCGRLDDRFMTTLVDALPKQIKSLSIDCEYYGFHPSSKFNLKNLEKCSLIRRRSDLIQTRAMKMPPPFEFNRLEHLELGLSFPLTDDWRRFITQSNHLTRLKLHSPKKECLTLIEDMPHLGVLSLIFNDPWDCNDIVPLMTKISSFDLRICFNCKCSCCSAK